MRGRKATRVRSRGQVAGRGNVSHNITYTYDDKTFRLTRLLTIRSGDSAVLQDLRYFFDAVGNITEVQDHGSPPIFSGTTPVSGTGKYEYDALYRLTYAEGREHPGQQPTDQDPARDNIPHQNDLTALERYEENYEYDEVGNIERMGHQSPNTNWARRYNYATTSNRLLGTSIPGDPDGIFSATYTCDTHILPSSCSHQNAHNPHSVYFWKWRQASGSRLKFLSPAPQDIDFRHASPLSQHARHGKEIC